MRSFCTAKAPLIFSANNISEFGYKVVKHLTSLPLNELVKLTMLLTTGPRYFNEMLKCNRKVRTFFSTAHETRFP